MKNFPGRIQEKFSYPDFVKKNFLNIRNNS